MDSSKPVRVSPGAKASLTYYMRKWTGWGSKANLVLGPPKISPFAECLHDPVFEITLSPESLLLNPNRVLNTVTPFRLRQEAVLTGALLHEAGHARHSHWQPGRYGNDQVMRHAGPWVGASGEPVSELVLEFAKVIEEARIEGLIAAEAQAIGAGGLAWTMRCSAMKVLPLTEVSTEPNQALLDVITSWVLRAGRQISTQHHIVGDGGGLYTMPSWVAEFNALVGSVIRDHIVASKEETGDVPQFSAPSAEPEATQAVSALYDAVTLGTDADEPGSTLVVDAAKKILDLLFPPSEQDGLAPQAGCPEDQGEDESDEEDSDGDESPGDAGSPGDGQDEADPDDTEGESDEDGTDGEGDTEPEDPGSGTDPGAGETGSDDAEPSQAQPSAAQMQQAKTQAALDDVEQAALKQAEQEKVDETASPSEQMGPGDTAGADSDGTPDGGPSGNAAGGKGAPVTSRNFRHPVPAEREIKREAGEFLRNIIDPSEAGKLQITDSPSASVDGAALAAWKAGGQKSDPRFFRRIKRTDTPAPPVKVAILVDVSASMNVLQEPSALLSWALASAALDLRNFAGRGVQVESTLIHWGNTARVIQANGEVMPGIHEDDCSEGTYAMHEALDLVAEQIPGFFEADGPQTNRLLVQFTDWELYGESLPDVSDKINRALAVGVNMLSVVPMDYSWRRTSLDDILNQPGKPRLGRTSLLKYNEKKPSEVWTAATELLSGADSSYGF